MIEKFFVCAGAVVVIITSVTMLKNLLHSFCYDMKHEQYRPFVENFVNYVIDLFFMSFSVSLVLIALATIIYTIME